MKFANLVIARGLARKARLPSKHGNNQYYKGSGTGSMGRHLKNGMYLVDPKKMRNFVVPDMGDCLLKPYVAYETPKPTAAIRSVQDYIEMAQRVK